MVKFLSNAHMEGAGMAWRGGAGTSSEWVKKNGYVLLVLSRAQCFRNCQKAAGKKNGYSHMQGRMYERVKK